MKTSFQDLIVPSFGTLMDELGFELVGDFTRREGHDRLLFVSAQARLCFMRNVRDGDIGCYLAKPLTGSGERVTSGAWFPYTVLIPSFRSLSQEALTARVRRALTSRQEFFLMMEEELREHFDAMLADLHQISEHEQDYRFWDQAPARQ